MKMNCNDPSFHFANTDNSQQSSHQFNMNMMSNRQPCQFPTMGASNSQHSQIAMNNGILPSFSSLSSSPSFFFGGGAAPLPSFDKINTVWQSQMRSTADIKLTQLSSTAKSNTLNTLINDKANTSWQSETPSTTSYKDEGDTLLEEIKLTMEASKRCGTATTNTVMSRSKKEKRILSADFEPNSFTVICGRSQHCYNSTGNRRFRLTVKMFLPDYVRAEGKTEKSEVVSRVLDVIQKGSPTAAFVAFEKGRFYEVSERVKREKIGGYFRELLPNTYKSSAKAKQAKKAAQAKSEQAKHLELQRLHSTRAPATVSNNNSSNNLFGADSEDNQRMMMPPRQRMGLLRQFDDFGVMGGNNLNTANIIANTDDNTNGFSSGTLGDSMLSMTSFTMDPFQNNNQRRF